MTSREQMLTEALREAERDLLIYDQIVAEHSNRFRKEAQPFIDRAFDRVATLQMALADACPCF